MAVIFKDKSAFSGKVPCFQVPPVDREVMGYRLPDTLPADTIIPQGTPIKADMANKTAEICKYAVIEKKVDTKNFIVKSVGFLAVGDHIVKSGTGSDSPTISTISAIDPSTRKITLSAANSVLAAGDVVVETTSTSDATPKALPNRIVSRAATLRVNDKTVSAAYKAVAIQNVLHYPAEYLNTTAFPGSTLLVGCPLILFVTQ